MRYLRSPFCKWVMPVRVVSVAMVIYGFARIFATVDPSGILIALAGSCLWPIGTVLEERSSSFQRLQNMAVGKLMRSRPVSVASWWTLAKVRSHFPGIDRRSFFVTSQDGYLSGIVLPEWVDGILTGESRHVAMAHVAHPIDYVDAVRQNDTLLDASSFMERLGRYYLPVTDIRENLVGIITREQITQFLLDGVELGSARDAHIEHPLAATAGNDGIAA